MSENKNIETKKEKAEGGAKISPRNLAFIITAAILVVIIIATSIVFIVNAIKNDAGFSYTKSDLSKYFEFTESYKDFTVEVDIAKPKDIDVDVIILQLLCQNKNDTPNYGGSLITSPTEIGIGDKVKIWYRGYILGEDGEKIEVDGMTNFTSSAPHELEIGSNGFIPGFEYNLIGKSTGDANKFEKITEGNLKEGQVAYVSFTRVKDDDSSTKVTKTSVRIDLSDDTIDEIYGKGFKENIMTGPIGAKKLEFETTLDDNSKYKYSDIKVDFATECENKPVVVETYFPYDYSKEILRNETAYFEVYFDGLIDYDAPEFTDDFIKERIEAGELKVTLEALNEYEGATLVDKYYVYVRDNLTKAYEEEYDTLLREAILEHYRTISKGIKYPEGKVKELYDEYYSNVEDSYIENEGKITNSYGSTSSYQSLDTYAVAYLGLTTGSDWKAYIRGIAEDAIKERYIMFYILRAENLMPTDDELKDKAAAVREDMIQEYIDQYLAYEGNTKEDYSEDAYKVFAAQRTEEIDAYYDNAYFEESAYFEIFMDAAVQWPNVSTFDDRRAYPMDK